MRRLLLPLAFALASGIACHAQNKTAPVAPSGVIAACSARELATALWLAESDKLKLKHGITLGSEIGGEGSATVGVEDPKTGAKAEFGGKVTGSFTEEKASELELNLPEDKLCVELGYRPQLGRWEHINNNNATYHGKPCVISDTNNCLCRPVGRRGPSCMEYQRERQRVSMKQRWLNAAADMKRHDEAAAKKKVKEKPLRDCLKQCSQDAERDFRASAGTTGDPELKATAEKLKLDRCLATCQERRTD